MAWVHYKDLPKSIEHYHGFKARIDKDDKRERYISIKGGFVDIMKDGGGSGFSDNDHPNLQIYMPWNSERAKIYNAFINLNK